MNLPEQDPMAIAVARDPRRWTHWPLLPLKRYQTGAAWFEEACLIDGTRVEPVIYCVVKTNVFAFDYNAPRQVYESLDAVFADGWRVD